MKLKGETLREDKAAEPGRLYKIGACRTIVLEESDTDDIVYIHFDIRDGQYGMYGNEYKPPFAADQGRKKADILALVVDERRNHFCSWVLDVKKAIGGEDVICHLVGQLAESVRHKRAIATYLEDFTEEQHIGYITRDLQRGRIQESIRKKRAYLEKEKANIRQMPVLIGMEARRSLLKEEAKLKILEAFWRNQIEIGKDTFEIEGHISKEQEGKFVCDLKVACS